MSTLSPSAPLSATPRHYLTNVQILRFFAALLVVCGHSEYEMLMMAGTPVEDGLRLLDWGLGVDIFFVISGFLMYYLMHDRFGKPGVSGDFIRRRLIRIVPLYWIFTTLLLLLVTLSRNAVTNNSLEPVHLVASYLFIPWPRADGQVFPLLSLGWTLNYEMFFYAVFALALLFRKTIGLGLLLGTFLLLSLAALVAPSDWWLLKFWGSPLIGEFVLGLGLAAVFLSGVRIRLPLFLLLVVVGLVLAVIFYQTRTYDTITRLVTGGLPAILITGATILLAAGKPGTVARLLAIGGDASYALYLSHPFAINIVRVVWNRLGLPPNATFVVVAVFASIAASITVYFLIEKPVIRQLYRLSGNGRPAKPLAP